MIQEPDLESTVPNDSSLEIRPALKEELGRVLELYDEVEYDKSFVPDLANAEAVFERMHQYPNYVVYVVQQKDKIVGAFSLLIMDNLAHQCAPSGVVEDVVVDHHYQGQGIGKQMMQFAIERCREAGCYKLALSSNIKRERAHHFYERLGFHLHGYSFAIPT